MKPKKFRTRQKIGHRAKEIKKNSLRAMYYSKEKTEPLLLVCFASLLILFVCTTIQ